MSLCCQYTSLLSQSDVAVLSIHFIVKSDVTVLSIHFIVKSV